MNGKETMEVKSGGVKSAQRTVRVIEALLESDEPLTMSEIVRRVELPKSSAHALLVTLENEGVLIRHPKLETYAISARWIESLSDGIERAKTGTTKDLRDKAHPLMVDLSRRIGMICNLGMLDGHAMVYIDKVDASDSPVRLSTAIGAAVPAHSTALGKALLAKMPPDELADWLDHHRFEALTHETLMTPDAIRADIEQTIARGYAMEREEYHVGITCVAAAVTNHRGQPIAAVSLTSLTGVVESTGVDVVGKAVCAMANELSELIG